MTGISSKSSAVISAGNNSTTYQNKKKQEMEFLTKLNQKKASWKSRENELHLSANDLTLRTPFLGEDPQQAHKNPRQSMRQSPKKSNKTLIQLLLQ